MFVAVLEEITKGAHVRGIIGDEIVTVVNVEWHGTMSIDVFYKDSEGRPGGVMLMRDAEERIEIVTSSLPWSFDGDGEKLRLVSEAYRIHLAHVFDPYLAVSTSSVEPLPHQISAVYEEMLPRLPLRFVLADDPGAGKTIMTGLFIKEMMVRGDMKRVLIVAPGSLVEQWQDELFSKFHIKFQILSNDAAENAVSGNIFTEMDLMIARLDKLSRSEELQAKLMTTEWDLIVVDEAHKMSASSFGNKINYTKRYQLGASLSKITRHFLLLTATPHNGKNTDFYLFLSLIDPDRFEGATRMPELTPDVKDIMRRLVKEELLKFDGRPLFPERRAETVSYDLSPMEHELYETVTEYVREQFNRADRIADGKQRNTVGFALTMLQRRLASSPEAIYQSLHRRRERLEKRLDEERTDGVSPRYGYIFDDDFDEDDLLPEELENENELTDATSASTNVEELEAEIIILKKLEKMADRVRKSGSDQKWRQLSDLMQDDREMKDRSGEREKLIIFTEHRDTLRYLADKLTTLIGSADAIVTIHGAMDRDSRRAAEERFKQDKSALILIATDAAGEGINLQRAHLMVNYDIPWNPNRLEQRFGRIHRIGQMDVCCMWNLVAKGTREGDVLIRLFEKLRREDEALDGKVFNVLGKIKYDNESLRDLLIQAIRYGQDDAVIAQLDKKVEDAFDRDKLRKLLEDNALTADSMDTSKVMRIREDMERMRARRLQPHYIEAFFIEAFKELSGKMRRIIREPGRYEVSYVPRAMRDRPEQISRGMPVVERYHRVCFDKDFCSVPGLPQADLICPGHPLLDAAISALRERYKDAMKQGAVYVDELSSCDEPRLLFYIENTIVDGAKTASGAQNVISKEVVFVELLADGTARNAGCAPYLDYRPATDAELERILPWLKTQASLSGDVERRAMDFAASHIIPEHYSAVRNKRLDLLNKISRAVKERMSTERDYWFKRAHELKHDEEEGKQSKGDRLNSQKARANAESMITRMDARLAELERERSISALPPVIIGGALIMPKRVADGLVGTPSPDVFGGADRKAVELAAMDAVMNIERELGNEPRDVSRENIGYDIESRVRAATDGASALRFIEVKGRAHGADTVTVTRNEMLCALNTQENYVLALVEVDGTHTHTTYIRPNFDTDPGAAQNSATFDIKKLITSSTVIYQD